MLARSLRGKKEGFKTHLQFGVILESPLKLERCYPTIERASVAQKKCKHEMFLLFVARPSERELYDRVIQLNIRTYFVFYSFFKTI